MSGQNHIATITPDELGKLVDLPPPGRYALAAAGEIEVRILEDEGRQAPHFVFTFRWPKEGVTFDILVDQKAVDLWTGKGPILLPPGFQRPS